MLQNANIHVKSYMVSDDEGLVVSDDGSRSMEVKDFLVQQKEVKGVTLDDVKYKPGDTTEKLSRKRSSKKSSKKEDL